MGGTDTSLVGRAVRWNGIDGVLREVTNEPYESTFVVELTDIGRTVTVRASACDLPEATGLDEGDDLKA